MYNWEYSSSESGIGKHIDLLLFIFSTCMALLLFFVFYPQIEAITRDSPIIINIMFFPAAAIGFLYGMRITERAVRPTEIRSPIKRSIVKIFLFFFVIGGMFSAVNFAMNGGVTLPQENILEDGFLVWAEQFVSNNGGATFLIITSISLMAGATKRIVGLNAGILNRVVACVGTFVFFTMLVLSFTKSDVNSSSVFLYTFYQAGVVGGAFYAMNKLTKNLNAVEDFANGF
jgi:hypothetical protein